MTRRRGMVRAVLGGVAAFALALGGVTVAAADEGPTTTITGTVTREDDGLPVPSIRVFVTNADFSKSGDATTDANGEYTVEGLEPGEYTVRFAADGTGTSLISEYWDSGRQLEDAQRITAVGGDTFTGIDASLRQGGTITGRVTRESDGSPVPSRWVTVSPNTLGLSPATGWTDENGVYRVEGVEPGAYTVRFDAPEDLSDEYWNGVFDQQSATPVSVAAGQLVEGIDASFTGGGTISGKVTKADGSPATGSVYASGGGSGFYAAIIAPDGSYDMAVPAGTYRVQFTSSDSRTISEYWENARTEAASTPVAVAQGQALTLDAELETGRAITGVVLADGQPLADAIVTAAVDGLQLDSMAYTDQNGRYELIAPTGEYTVRAWGSEYEPVYAWQYFDGADSASEATNVTVGTTADRTGVDFDLDRGGAIAGSVATSGGEFSGAGAEISAYLWSGGAWRHIATENTTTVFALGAHGGMLRDDGGLLPAGEYTIGIEAEGFCTQFLGGSATLEGADSVELSAGEVLSELAFTLTSDCVEPEPEPELRLSAGTIVAGNEISISGTGFTPGATIAFELHSDPIALGTLVADAGGVLKGTLRIPASAPAGAHTLVALSGSTVVATAALQVTAGAVAGGTGSGSGSATVGGTGGALANTGSDAPVAVAMAALVLLLAGLTLVRRRRAIG